MLAAFRLVAPAAAAPNAISCVLAGTMAASAVRELVDSRAHSPGDARSSGCGCPRRFVLDRWERRFREEVVAGQGRRRRRALSLGATAVALALGGWLAEPDSRSEHGDDLQLGVAYVQWLLVCAASR